MRRTTYEQHIALLKRQHPDIYSIVRASQPQTSNPPRVTVDKHRNPHQSTTNWRHFKVNETRTQSPTNNHIYSSLEPLESARSGRSSRSSIHPTVTADQKNMAAKGIYKMKTRSPWDDLENLNQMYSQLHLESDVELLDRADFQEHLKIMFSCGERVNNTRYKKVPLIPAHTLSTENELSTTSHEQRNTLHCCAPLAVDDNISEVDVHFARATPRNSVCTGASTPSSFSSASISFGSSVRSTPTIKERMEMQIERNLRERHKRIGTSMDTPRGSESSMSGSISEYSRSSSTSQFSPRSPHFLGTSVQSKSCKNRLPPSREEHEV